MSKTILIILLLLGLILRFYKLDIPMLEFYPSRQIQTADIARNFVLNDFNVLSPTISYLGPGYVPFLLEFPGYNFSVAMIYKIAGSTDEIYGRLLSVSGWLVAATFLYLLAKMLVSKFAALVAVYFYTISPLSVLISRSFQPDQWMLTFSIVAIYFSLRWSKSGKLAYLFVCSFCISLSLLLKTHSFIFTLLPCIYLIFTCRRTGSRLLPYSVLFLGLLPPLAWYLYSYLQNQGGRVMQAAFTLSTYFGVHVFFDPKYYSNIFGFEYNLVLLPIGITLFTLGLFARNKRSSGFLSFWLLSIILYFLIFNKHNMTHEYYHLPLLPVATLFIGLGAEVISRSLGNLPLSKSLIIFLMAILIFILTLPNIMLRAYKPIERFGHVVETANEIKTLTSPAELIVASMDAGPTLVYYANRNGWPFEINRGETEALYTFYGENDHKVPDPRTDLENLRSRGATIYAAANKNQFLDNEKFSEYMYRHYPVLVENRNFIIFSLKRNKHAG